MKEFKFVIRWTVRDIYNNRSIQTFQISAQFPHFVYSIPIEPGDKMADQDQQRLAIAELKVRLIQGIANARFELETE